MNDRYLFKAKRIDNGEWIVGNLLTIAKINSFICTGKIKLDGALKGHIYPEMYAVDESTVCQCVDLTDKYGTVIFENDIVVIPKEWGYFLVNLDEDAARFVMNGDGLTVDFDNYWSHEVEVVGNKADNPELLEVE